MLVSFQKRRQPIARRLMPRTVFVAHQMTGDLEGNTAKVVAICRAIHSEEIIPVHPSFTTRRYLTADPRDRELAKAHREEYFRRGMIDELWLYGKILSDGMWEEVQLARKYNIPVFAKSAETRRGLSERTHH